MFSTNSGHSLMFLHVSWLLLVQYQFIFLYQATGDRIYKIGHVEIAVTSLAGPTVATAIVAVLTDRH